MSYRVVKVERTETAEALLDTAKAHMRVEFERDDEYIKLCVIRAIDMMERFSGARIFKTEALWTPYLVGSAWAYQTPLQPIASFTATANNVDVSNAYALESASEVEPVWLYKIGGLAFDAGIEVALVAGYEPEQIPPMYLDPVLRMAAHLYEHRESVDATNLMQIPGWANDLMCGTWIPRV